MTTDTNWRESLRRIAASLRDGLCSVDAILADGDRMDPPGRTINCPPIVFPSMVPANPPKPDPQRLLELHGKVATECRRPVDGEKWVSPHFRADQWHERVWEYPTSKPAENYCDGRRWIVEDAQPVDPPLPDEPKRPAIPPGYRLKPEKDGGGYRPWKKGEWILTIDGQARCAKGVGGTSSAWILEPVAPCVVFVQDEAGPLVMYRNGEVREWDAVRTEYEMRCRRIKVPAAVVEKWLADTGNTQIRPGKLNLITPEGDDDD